SVSSSAAKEPCEPIKQATGAENMYPFDIFDLWVRESPSVMKSAAEPDGKEPVAKKAASPPLSEDMRLQKKLEYIRKLVNSEDRGAMDLSRRSKLYYNISPPAEEIKQTEAKSDEGIASPDERAAPPPPPSAEDDFSHDPPVEQA